MLQNHHSSRSYICNSQLTLTPRWKKQLISPHTHMTLQPPKYMTHRRGSFRSCTWSRCQTRHWASTGLLTPSLWGIYLELNPTFTHNSWFKWQTCNKRFKWFHLSSLNTNNTHFLSRFAAGDIREFLGLVTPDPASMAPSCTPDVMPYVSTSIILQHSSTGVAINIWTDQQSLMSASLMSPILVYQSPWK